MVGAYKIRLVLLENANYDVEQTYAPVMRPETIKVMIASAHNTIDVLYTSIFAALFYLVTRMNFAELPEGIEYHAVKKLTIQYYNYTLYIMVTKKLLNFGMVNWLKFRLKIPKYKKIPTLLGKSPIFLKSPPKFPLHWLGRKNPNRENKSLWFANTARKRKNSTERMRNGTC